MSSSYSKEAQRLPSFDSLRLPPVGSREENHDPAAASPNGPQWPSNNALSIRGPRHSLPPSAFRITTVPSCLEPRPPLIGRPRSQPSSMPSGILRDARLPRLTDDVKVAKKMRHSRKEMSRRHRVKGCIDIMRKWLPSCESPAGSRPRSNEYVLKVAAAFVERAAGHPAFQELSKQISLCD